MAATMKHREALERAGLNLAALYLRNVPFEWGRWRVLRRAVPLSRKLYSKTDRRIIRTRHGFRMQVDLGDWLGRHVYLTGEYEPGVTQVMKALARPGDTVVDVGANAGYFTLLAAQCVGASGKVFAFEPSPSTRELLLQNMHLSGRGTCEVRPEALSDCVGETAFYVGAPSHTGLSSLRSVTDCDAKIAVHTARFDDVMRMAPRVDVVKIDVEGAEVKVLKGMEDCLERSQPDIIIEVTDRFLREMGDTAAELEETLTGKGYRMFVIHDDGLAPVTTWTKDRPEQFNALFTVRDALPTGLRVKNSV